MKSSALFHAFECGPLPPLRPPCVHLTSFMCSQAFPVFRALPLPCIMQTEEQKTGEAWERGYLDPIFRRVRRARAKNLVWGRDYVQNAVYIASLPGPAQLSVAFSTVSKRRKAGRGLVTRLQYTHFVLM